MRTPISLLLLVLLLSCTKESSLPTCPTPLFDKSATGLLHGSGRSTQEALTLALSPKRSQEGALQALWRAQDRRFPLSSGEKRAHLHHAYLAGLTRSLYNCALQRACKSSTHNRVHIWASCTPSPRRHDHAFLTLLSRLKAVLEPHAKVAVVGSSLPRKEKSQGERLTLQLFEDLLYQATERGTLHLIRPVHEQQLLWDLVPAGVLEEDTMLWGRDAHYLLKIAPHPQGAHWTLTSLKSRYPKKLQSGTLPLPRELGIWTSPQRALHGDPSGCRELQCTYEAGLTLYQTGRVAQGIPLLRKACLKGHQDACLLAATYNTLTPKGARAAIATYLPVIRRACSKGRLRACTLQGMLTLRTAVTRAQEHKTPLYPKERDPKGRAMKLFTRACNQNEPMACIKRARLLQEGQPLVVLAHKSVLYKRACSLGVARGCAEASCFNCYLSLTIQMGRDPYSGPHFTAHKAMVHRACRAGRPGGCLGLPPLPGVTNPEKLLALERACAWGYTPACTSAGEGNLNPQLATFPKPPRAARFFQLGCEDEEREACHLLGKTLLSLGQIHAGLSQLTRTCERGEWEACLTLGEQLVAGRKVQRNYRKALALFKRASQIPPRDSQSRLVKYRAFAWLGHLYTLGLGTPSNPEHGQHLLSSSCEAGVGEACYMLAQLLLGDTPDHLRQQAALPFFKKGCRQGSHRACGWLAQRAKMARALRQWLRHTIFGCGAGDGAACFAAGTASLNKRGAPQNTSRARKLFTRGCALKHGRSCWALALLYKKDNPKSYYLLAQAPLRIPCGQGALDACVLLATLSSPKRVIRWLSEGCSAGDIHNCMALGDLLRDHPPFTSHPRRARALYALSCEKGNLPGCVKLGQLHLKGLGGAKSEPLALRYTKLACERGDPAGCGALGALYETSRVAPKPKLALLSYQMACTAGFLPGCGAGGRLALELGNKTSSPALLQRAHKMLAPACSGGNLKACYQHATLFTLPLFPLHNLRKGIQLLEQLCTRHHQESCILARRYTALLRGQKTRSTPKERDGSP